MIIKNKKCLTLFIAATFSSSLIAGEEVLNIHPNASQMIFKDKTENSKYKLNLPDSYVIDSFFALKISDESLHNVNNFIIKDKDVFTLKNLKSGKKINFKNKGSDNYIFESMDQNYIYYRKDKSDSIHLMSISDLGENLSLDNVDSNYYKTVNINMDYDGDIIGSYVFTGIDWSRNYFMYVDMEKSKVIFKDIINIKNNTNKSYQDIRVRLLNKNLNQSYHHHQKQMMRANIMADGEAFSRGVSIQQPIVENISGKEVIVFNSVDLGAGDILYIPNEKKTLETNFGIKYYLNLNFNEIKKDRSVVKNPFYNIEINKNKENKELFNLFAAPLKVYDKKTLSLLTEVGLGATNSDFLDVNLGLAEGLQISIKSNNWVDLNLGVDDFYNKLTKDLIYLYKNGSVNFSLADIRFKIEEDKIKTEGKFDLNLGDFFIIDEDITKNEIEKHYKKALQDYLDYATKNYKVGASFVNFKQYYVEKFKKDYKDSLYKNLSMERLNMIDNVNKKIIKIY